MPDWYRKAKFIVNMVVLKNNVKWIKKNDKLLLFAPFQLIHAKNVAPDDAHHGGNLNIEVLFGIGVTLLILYNFINQWVDKSQISRNKNSINSLTHMVDIQEDHLEHLDIEVGNDSYYYLQQLQFNPALLL
jgi:hypothetical protein